MKFFGIIFAAVTMFAAAVAAEVPCVCDDAPYVNYILNEEAELDENPWEVVGVERFDVDLTQDNEPEVCVVKLELIDHTKPLLYQDFQIIPAGDMELHFHNSWILASEFENQMDDSGCDITRAMS